MKSIDTILLGRVTYQMFAGYWPTVTEDEDSDFAAKLNATPKVVFSRSLERAPWGKWESARIVKTPADEEVAKRGRELDTGLVKPISHAELVRRVERECAIRGRKTKRSLAK